MDSRIGHPGTDPASFALAVQKGSCPHALVDPGVSELHNPCRKHGKSLGDVGRKLVATRQDAGTSTACESWKGPCEQMVQCSGFKS